MWSILCQWPGGVVCRIQGRIEDFIICKDGTKVGRLDHIFKGANNVKVAQLVQKEVGTVTILIVPDNSFCLSDEKRILDGLTKRVGLNNLDVQVEQVGFDKLIKSKSGKFKYLINQIQN